MGRPTTLTEEQRKEKRKELDSSVIKFVAPKSLKDKFDKYCEGKNKTEVLIKILNSNSDFKSFKY